MTCVFKYSTPYIFMDGFTIENRVKNKKPTVFEILLSDAVFVLTNCSKLSKELDKKVL